MQQLFRHGLSVICPHGDHKVCPVGLMPNFHLYRAFRFVRSPRPCAGNEYLAVERCQRLWLLSPAH